MAGTTQTACHCSYLLKGHSLHPPPPKAVSGTRWSRRHLFYCAVLLLFRPRQTNENATRRQAEVAKRFEEEKAAVALRKEEVDVSRGRDEEEKDSRKEGGETKEENDQAGRGGGDGDFDKADEEGPEAEDYDAETEVLENKEKKALMDCLSHGRAKWPDAGITTSHMYAVIGLVILMGLQPLAEIRCHWDTRPMYDFPHVRECMTRNFFLLIYCRYIHMASKQSGTPGEDGYDILHHIRYYIFIYGCRYFPWKV